MRADAIRGMMSLWWPPGVGMASEGSIKNPIIVKQQTIDATRNIGWNFIVFLSTSKILVRSLLQNLRSLVYIFSGVAGHMIIIGHYNKSNSKLPFILMTSLDSSMLVTNCYPWCFFPARLFNDDMICFVGDLSLVHSGNTFELYVIEIWFNVITVFLTTLWMYVNVWKSHECIL